MSASTPSLADPPAPQPLALPRIGFFANDPDYAPFGISWLRGVTALRVGFFVLLCCVHQSRVMTRSIASGGIDSDLFWSIVFAFMRWIPLMVLVIQSELRTREWRMPLRVAGIGAAIALGALISQALGVATMAYHPYSAYHLLRLPGEPLDPLIERLALSGFFSLMVYGGILAAVLGLESRARSVERRIHGARMAQVSLERQAAEAELRLLDAQIEPHFLFNTLASAKRLCESNPAEGRALLRDLVAYLREAAPLSRLRETTLGAEAALTHSLLGIFKVRMGERLRFAVDVPEELREARIPPLMLSTLVENAIKHGVGPRATGGAVRIAARRDGNTLVIEVADDGVGFQTQSGHGVGLANVRARLATLFGSDGQLLLARNRDGGVTATLRLPYSAGGSAR